MKELEKKGRNLYHLYVVGIGRKEVKYISVANSVEHVKQIAREKGYNIDNLRIGLETVGVRNSLGEHYDAFIAEY